MYLNTILTKTVVVIPNQMNHNLINNILDNLREDVEGKCYKQYGVIIKVHEIEGLYGGVIPAEDIRAAAYYTVKFTCTLCRPEEGAVVGGKVVRIGNGVIIMENGPVNIFVPIKEPNKYIKINNIYKAKVLSVTLINGDNNITIIGQLIH